MSIKRFYGLKGPDKIDRRDFQLSFSRKLTLPASYSIRTNCPPIMDQGQLSSCVANACVGAMEFNEEGTSNYLELSRLMLYYLARVVDGDVHEDDGTNLRTAISCLANQGTCEEYLWPYITDDFADEPTPACYSDALNRRILAYHRIVSMFDMKACLASGKPFVLGIPVYESFEDDNVAKTGTVPMPSFVEEIFGYHAVYCCGFDDRTQRFTCANSWGISWGDKGFFTLPYAYIEDYVVPEGAGDCWTITSEMIP